MNQEGFNFNFTLAHRLKRKPNAWMMNESLTSRVPSHVGVGNILSLNNRYGLDPKPHREPGCLALFKNSAVQSC